MKLIFLFGEAGVGKLTVARSLQQATGYRLFHNHLVVDTLLAVFPFGSAPFVRLREQFWLEVFAEAAAANTSLIFTFSPERTVRPSFIAKTLATITLHSGAVHFVQLTCAPAELARRIEDPSRGDFGKLLSAAQRDALSATGAFTFPSIPADLVLDTTHLDPAESARRIVEHFRLLV